MKGLRVVGVGKRRRRNCEESKRCRNKISIKKGEKKDKAKGELFN